MRAERVFTEANGTWASRSVSCCGRPCADGGVRRRPRAGRCSGPTVFGAGVRPGAPRPMEQARIVLLSGDGLDDASWWRAIAERLAASRGRVVHAVWRILRADAARRGVRPVWDGCATQEAHPPPPPGCRRVRCTDGAGLALAVDASMNSPCARSVAHGQAGWSARGEASTVASSRRRAQGVTPSRGLGPRDPRGRAVDRMSIHQPDWFVCRPVRLSRGRACLEEGRHVSRDVQCVSKDTGWGTQGLGVSLKREVERLVWCSNRGPRAARAIRCVTGGVIQPNEEMPWTDDWWV